MAAKREAEYRRYIIPENVADGGSFMGFKIRNIVEGIGMAVIAVIPVLSAPIRSFSMRISVVILTAVTFLVLGAVGVNGDPISSFLKHVIIWNKDKGLLLYNGTVRFLERSPVDSIMEQKDLRDHVVEIMEQRKRRLEEIDRGKVLVEGVDFEFMLDKDEQGLIVERQTGLQDLSGTAAFDDEVPIPVLEVESELTFEDAF